jgi:hypothetical protein
MMKPGEDIITKGIADLGGGRDNTLPSCLYWSSTAAAIRPPDPCNILGS